MTREQAIYLCNRIMDGDAEIAVQAHRPNIKKLVVGNSMNTGEWAYLLREASEALAPQSERSGTA